MQSSHHVHLCNSELNSISHCLDNFVDRIFKRVSIAFFSSKRAKLAGQDANVRVIDVAVVDIACVVAVLSFAHDVRNHSEGVKIVRAI